MAATSPNAYAPLPLVACPQRDLLRRAPAANQTLNAQEQAYVTARDAGALAAWQAWVGDGATLGYNLTALQAHLPRIAIGVSGGSFRAANYAAGTISALDARNATARASGTGGMLQVATYLGGISGGSWFTGSMVLNGFPTAHDLVLGNVQTGGSLQGWLTDLNLVIPAGVDLLNSENQYLYGSVLGSVYAKAFAGFSTGITDPWARLVSYHFLNGTTRDNFFLNSSSHGAGQLWSNIPTLPEYQAHAMPFPVVVMDSRPAKSNWSNVASLDFPVYEVTPFEFGSWDPFLSIFSELAFTGTNLVNGQPANATACVSGFDEAGFVIGTSSSFFNVAFNQADMAIQPKDNIFDTISAKAFSLLLQRLISQVRTAVVDAAAWPNPFQGVNNGSFVDSGSPWLELIDGGSNLENVPIAPFLVKARNVDVIVAVDASDEDKNHWPTGRALLATQNRTSLLDLTASHQPLPPLPASEAVFVNLGIRFRPTFFGCNPTQTPPEWPLLVYLPNAPPIDGSSPLTNTATTKLSYTPKHSSLFLDAAQAGARLGFTPFSTAPDVRFGKCLQCAALDRARLRATPPPARSGFCQACFTQYCFDPAAPPPPGQVVGRKTEFVDPDPQGAGKLKTFFEEHKGPVIGGTLAVALVLVGLFVFFWRRARMARSQAAYQQIHAPAPPPGAPYVYSTPWETPPPGAPAFYQAPGYAPPSGPPGQFPAQTFAPPAGQAQAQGYAPPPGAPGQYQAPQPFGPEAHWNAPPQAPPVQAPWSVQQPRESFEMARVGP